jgi:hypothetical protein
MTKLKAFAIHLGISLVIFAVLLALILFVWYPDPFFTYDGGWQGIRIIAAVDLVLGPVLTLIVYKKGKWGLRFDLTMIGISQFLALCWGIWVTYTERPVAVVLSESRFYILPASVMSEIGYSRSDLLRFGERLPVWIYSKVPQDIEEAQKVLVRAIRSNTPMYHFTEYYADFYSPENHSAILAAEINMRKYTKDNKKYQETYARFVTEHASDIDNIAFFSFKGKYSKRIVALRRDTLAYVDSLDIVAPLQAELYSGKTDKKK